MILLSLKFCRYSLLHTLLRTEAIRQEHNCHSFLTFMWCPSAVESSLPTPHPQPIAEIKKPIWILSVYAWVCRKLMIDIALVSQWWMLTNVLTLFNPFSIIKHSCSHWNTLFRQFSFRQNTLFDSYYHHLICLLFLLTRFNIQQMKRISIILICFCYISVDIVLGCSIRFMWNICKFLKNNPGNIFYFLANIYRAVI